MKKYVIIGPAQSGKSTFAKFLADELGTTYTDLSGWIIDVETTRTRRLIEQNVYEGGAWDMFRDRPKREFLIALGDAVCALDPAFLISRAFERAPIIAGVRRMEEFKTLEPDVMKIFIDRRDIPNIKDIFDISSDEADFVVDNNGTLEELQNQAILLPLLGTNIKIVPEVCEWCLGDHGAGCPKCRK